MLISYFNVGNLGKKQCEQIVARLFVQFLVTYNNENLTNNIPTIFAKVQ